MAIIIGELNKTVYGTNQNDDIYVTGEAAAYGKRGNDTIHGGGSNNKLYGQDGDDTIYCDEVGNSAWGGRGNDELVAFDFSPAKLYGEAGNDGLIGSSSDDFLNGGAGDDHIRAGGGIDTVRGGTGNDTLFYLNDERFPGGGSFSGGAGYDILHMAFSGPTPYVEIRITGESKGAVGSSSGLVSDDFSKTLDFTGINEFVIRQLIDGSDQLLYRGGDSDSTVTGSAVADIFVGGAGNETFIGDNGEQSYPEGPSSDAFIFDFRPANLAPHPGELSMGHDQVLDFEPGVDTLAFRGGEGQITTAKDEEGGITTYTTSDLAGNVLHILDVVGVGLPDLIGHTDFV